MNNLWRIRVSYQFKNEPRECVVESEQQELPIETVAMPLLQLHFGDGENSLIIPSADAAPVEVLRQAELLGIAGIIVSNIS
ncbi:hypothetical protein [Pseudomonas syringae]|uniref:Uncharacterized protein n=1 Tax=Pseudomonas syringae TaxID=317 RepID=A0A085VQ57_PSESX|nr:hypothetical protein [Pseudomonas syringae]KFE57570.1 hypothetical protein IV01_03170 [Pseudomonas syringae]